MWEASAECTYINPFVKGCMKTVVALFYDLAVYNMGLKFI